MRIADGAFFRNQGQLPPSNPCPFQDYVKDRVKDILHELGNMDNNPREISILMGKLQAYQDVFLFLKENSI